MAEQKKEPKKVVPPGRVSKVRDVPSGDEQMKEKQAALRKKLAAAGSNGKK